MHTFDVNILLRIEFVLNLYSFIHVYMTTFGISIMPNASHCCDNIKILAVRVFHVDNDRQSC